MPSTEMVSGEVQICSPPMDFCGTVESLNDAFLRLRVDLGCHTSPVAEVNYWLSTYGLDPADVAELVVDAVRTRRFWILTHPEWKTIVERRVEALVSDDALPRRYPA